MPSGPKKRRAARKKNDGDASFTHPWADVKMDADAELSEILSTVPEVSNVDVHAEVKPEIYLKEKEGTESECVETLFFDSGIEQEMINKKFTKCSQLFFGGDLEGVTLESIVQPLVEPVVNPDVADSSLESVLKEANGAFDKQLESDFKEPAPPIDISGDEKDQAKPGMTLLEQLLQQSTEGQKLAQKQMEVYKKVTQIIRQLLDGGDKITKANLN